MIGDGAPTAAVPVRLLRLKGHLKYQMRTSAEVQGPLVLTLAKLMVVKALLCGKSYSARLRMSSGASCFVRPLKSLMYP